MPTLEDEIRAVLLDAADRGQPDMTMPELDSLVIDMARKLRPRLIGAAASRPQDGKARTDRPTDRQLQILGLYAESADVQSITAALGISKATIHDHMRRLAKNWDLDLDAVLLVNAGFERGWLPASQRGPEVDVTAQDLAALGLMAAGRWREAPEVLACSAFVVVEVRSRLMRALGAASDAGLVAAAWRAGLLPVARVSAVAS